MMDWREREAEGQDQYASAMARNAARTEMRELVRRVEQLERQVAELQGQR